MAAAPRLLQILYRMYFRFWIPTLAWASTCWPRGLMYWMARNLVMLPFNILRPMYLRTVKSNYSRILALPIDHPEVKRVAVEMMWEHAYHWIDFFRWSQWPIAKLLANIDGIEGDENFSIERRGKQGILFLTAHMGNSEVGASALGRHVEPIHVLYWRDRFVTAEEYRKRMRLRGNVQGIPVDASPFSAVPAMRVLESGGILAAHGDRDFNDQGWTMEFFGAPAKFPPGPFILAARTQALIVPTFFLAQKNRRFKVIHGKPMTVNGEGSLEQRAREAMAAWIKVLEHYIHEYPAQWYCFYPFWGQEIT